MEQVDNLAKVSFVQERLHKRDIKIHGWVYDMESGTIKVLKDIVDEPEDIDEIFRYEW